MKYSIIVAVYNRLDEVKELLDSAEKMEGERNSFEILFVDDGSKDAFKPYIEKYRSRSGLNIRAIFQENKGPGAARNYGMENSDADYFIFVDSDCMFTFDWLSEIERVQAMEHYDAFGGPDSCHESFPTLLKAINYSMTSFIGTGGTRGNKKSVGKFYPRSFNMGISRKIYEKIGGMGDLRHGQDMDFSARIYEAGFKVGLIADAIVYHKRRTSYSKFFKQIFNWGVARINLGRRHKNMLKPVHFLPLMVIFWLVFLGIATPFFPEVSLILWIITWVVFISICAFAKYQAALKYKDIRVGIVAMITLNIQVFAYGFGLIWGIWNAIRGKEVQGFSKNYYGKKKD
jgi:glycosyltransferase involved in cell wall biosynthesis